MAEPRPYPPVTARELPTGCNPPPNEVELYNENNQMAAHTISTHALLD
ncbi:hypothetical protein [Paraburkholderia sp.]|nr:hypothetical protein [Paraburkholderia sp.]